MLLFKDLFNNNRQIHGSLQYSRIFNPHDELYHCGQFFKMCNTFKSKQLHTKTNTAEFNSIIRNRMAHFKQTQDKTYK